VTELAALSVLINGDASGLKAAIASSVGLVDRFSKDAEASAKVFEKAFAADERAVDRLRKAIDPLYASSKRYEGAVEMLDKALARGSITQATHAQMLAKTNAAYLGASTAATRQTGALMALGNMSSATKGKVQNFGYQIQDMAIQFQMGTNAATVFAQQGSQIFSIFGPVGAVLGTLAAVGIPLLAAAFATAETEGRKFSEVLSDITDKTSALKEAQSILEMSVVELYQKYGLYAAAVRDAALALVELRAADAKTQLADTIIESADALGQFAGAANSMFSSGVTVAQAMVNIRDEFGLTGKAAGDLRKAFADLRDAVSFEDRVAALQRIKEVLDAAGISADQIPPALRRVMDEAHTATIASADLKRTLDMATAAADALKNAGPKSGWLAGAIADASALGAELWNAAQAKAAIGGDASTYTGGQSSGRGTINPSRMDAQYASTGWIEPPKKDGKKGGGGGGGTSLEETLARELEAVQTALMTQEEAQLASYTRQQETLRLALEQKLITQKEYNALMQDAQQQHQDAMAGIDAYRYGTGLQKTEAFMGGMASALSKGGDKMVRAAQIFGAAEALINAWRAYTQTLADPTLPFAAKFAAAASVLSAGMGAVSAIKGGSKSGGGGSSSGGGDTSTSSPAAMPTQRIDVAYSGPPEMGMQSLVDTLNDAAARGLRVDVRLVSA